MCEWRLAMVREWMLGRAAPKYEGFICLLLGWFQLCDASAVGLQVDCRSRCVQALLKLPGYHSIWVYTQTLYYACSLRPHSVAIKSETFLCVNFAWGVRQGFQAHQLHR
jgi:hypothetical protein